MRIDILAPGLILLGTSITLAETPGPSQLITNSSAYDGKHLTVSGAIRNVIAKTSQRGNDYETFDLCDKSCVLGASQLREAQHLSVSGTFDAVKHVGRYSFYNELDADKGSLK
jgi:hypothetical protein